MIADFILEFSRYRSQSEKALVPVPEDQFFQKPSVAVNPLACIVKHMAGNLKSRWTNFLTADGEKPDRHRDQEFGLTDADTRANLMAAWHQGWEILFNTLRSLTDADLDRVVTIRGEPHTIFQALLRSVNHAAYHAGQILYVSRMAAPDAPWLTIAPGASTAFRAGYLHKPKT